MLPVLFLLLAACQEEVAAPVAPEAHAWKDEAELVSEGLREVVSLAEGGSRPAARVMAERVYTERFEPKLEPALRQIEGPVAAAEVEYTFGLLMLDLEGAAPPNRIEDRVRTLDTRVRAIAESAARSFPSPSDLAAPPPPRPEEGSKPVVPDVKPKWEAGQDPR
jgi:hypothetical protein